MFTPAELSRFVVALGAGIAFWLLCSFLVWRLKIRRLRDLEAEPPRQAMLALYYGENPHRRSKNRPIGGLPVIAMCATVILHPASGPTAYWVWGGIAVLSLPAIWNDLHDYARSLTVRPVIAAHREGLYLSNWRRTTFLPWTEVDLVYTDPPDCDGYVAEEEKVFLHVESKRGRKWRFGNRDFAPDSPSEFARLVALAAIHAAPPDSMLIRGGF